MFQGGRCLPPTPDLLPPLHSCLPPSPPPHLPVSGRGQEGTSGDQSVPGLPGAWTAACHHSRELTPLEEASLQNQKLKAAYEARMARLDPSQAMQKTSLVSGVQEGLE